MSSTGPRAFRLIVHALTCFAAGTGTGLLLFAVLAGLGVANKIPEPVLKPLLAGLWFVPFLIGGILAWRRVSYRWMLPAMIVILVGLGYFAYDDPGRPAAPVLGPLIAGDDPGYLTYRWMLKDVPDSRIDQLHSDLKSLPRFPAKPEEWAVFLAQNRPQIESAWDNDTLGRTWIETVAEMKTGAYFSSGKSDSPLLAFSPLRFSVQTRWAKAGLLSLDGNHDEGALTLLPILGASHQLQRSAATLVEQMVAVVFIKGTQERLRLIVETGKLSPETRTRALETLESAPPLSLVFKNMFVGEQLYARGTFEKVGAAMDENVTMLARESKLGATPGWLHPLIFNPHRTEREYGEILNACQTTATRRATTKAPKTDRGIDEEMSAWSLKNPVGRALHSLALPAFSKVIENTWIAEDQRMALIRKLRASPER
jgi:hypothetical protein